MACLPFFQLDTEFIEHGAGDLAALLDVDESAAGWAMVRLWTWVVSRQWERDTPPDGVVEGANADKLVERAAGWTGTPGAFVAALMDPAVQLAERTERGLRIRGTDRYAEAWEKKRAERQRWHARNSKATPADSGGTPAEHQRSTAGKNQKKNQKKITTSAPAARERAEGVAEAPTPADTPPPVRLPVALAAREARPLPQPCQPPAEVGPAPEVAFFARLDERRREALPRAMQERPPPGWPAWYREALAAVEGDEERLFAAWEAYLADEWARSLKPPCAVVGFCGKAGVWRKHVPGQGEGAAPAARSGRGSSSSSVGMREVRACAVCSEASESTCGEQWLCYGCQPRWHEDPEVRRLCDALDWPGLAQRTAAWVQELRAGGASIAAGGAA